MPRNYTVSAENVTLTTAGGDADLVELDAATDKPIELYGIGIYITSEVQEAQEEWLRMEVIRGHTTSGSTPSSSPTPRPHSPVDTAAGFAAEIFNTTIASRRHRRDPVGVRVERQGGLRDHPARRIRLLDIRCRPAGGQDDGRPRRRRCRQHDLLGREYP